ncbi:hypothetical protein GCM10029963_76030 [Micromonospora andamanensis]|uniref:LIC_13387 family protein n=1 Tax=Micromonospora andamanensis TaxID=1287068 RepID=UPI00195059A0|nr:hypothetical protein [Micromonospora andamanensis]GIJ41137.1 hypothetical protein Vwe01_44620 [Micromonospora andamanensis]
MRSSFYRTGAWFWIITGLGHTAGDIAMRISPSDADREFDATLREHVFSLMGTHTSHYDLFMGFSLAMGLATALAGLLFLMLERFAAVPRQVRAAAIVGLGTSSGMLALSIAVFPLPPIVFFTIASVAFAVAVFSGRVSTSPAHRLNADTHN